MLHLRIIKCRDWSSKWKSLVSLEGRGKGQGSFLFWPLREALQNFLCHLMPSDLHVGSIGIIPKGVSVNSHSPSIVFCIFDWKFCDFPSLYRNQGLGANRHS